jgi:galactose-1-phosphate uridylyltransferase
MNISFEKIVSKAKIQNRENDSDLDLQKMEYRRDPLTGRICTVIIGFAEKLKLLGETDRDLINRIAEATRKTCPFCPEAIEKVTPIFPKEYFPEGRIKTGESVLFPNLFPRSEFEAVAVLSRKHYLKLDEFTPELLANALKSCLIFIDRIKEMGLKEKYATIGCNNLFPAGASSMHPHIQVSVRSVPFFMNEILIDRSNKFFKSNGSNFWDELIMVEKELGERYIGSIGRTEWIVPFAPMGGNDVMGIIKHRSNLTEFSEDDLMDLGKGLSKILKYYEYNGLSSFNFVIHSGPINEELEYFWSSLRIMSRANLRDVYISTDSWYGTSLLLEGVSSEYPEKQAEKIRGFFHSK